MPLWVDSLSHSSTRLAWVEVGNFVTLMTDQGTYFAQLFEQERAERSALFAEVRNLIETFETMLTDYIQSAMQRATYRTLDTGQTQEKSDVG
jgi:hypothetical protein